VIGCPFPHLTLKSIANNQPAKEEVLVRLELGEPWASDLTDFCAANYGGSKTEVIREAIDEHIQRRLQEPGMKVRFDKERQKRLGS
jgi:hypothetical protein